MIIKLWKGMKMMKMSINDENDYEIMKHKITVDIDSAQPDTTNMAKIKACQKEYKI